MGRKRSNVAIEVERQEQAVLLYNYLIKTANASTLTITTIFNSTL